ncbi:hypothetical protein OE88DRAFT_1627945 [Heliocybe sulcata]|uniref:Uncharacterized protein n=1 Tax=Heliocybe sulcata TaxID=5364 RepID=A0A5C3N595_9AGAM|nr:hypothetical protein OE88DRAFT_1627945 [Heliocybe sulcata]
MASVNGIISASKLRLRHWRNVRDSKHLFYVAGCHTRSLAYLPSTCNNRVQKRCASSAKVLLSQDRHHIPKSDTPPTAAGGRRRPSASLVRTLKQTRLAAEDFVDLTGQITKTVRFSAAPEQPGFSLRYWRPGGRGYASFPPDSHGFFYWHLEPDAPPLSGQVRFRTTTSSDPATFPSGCDLQLPDGGTWNISLFEIARRSQYSVLRAHLLSEKLVTAKVLDTALTISAQRGASIIHPGAGSLLIWKFGQIFPVDLGHVAVSFWVIGNSAGERLHLQRLFSVGVRESGGTRIVNYMPFTGQALVQFERSTLPEHKGTRTVVLRIVKVIALTKPEASEDVSERPEPQEGGLVMTRTVGRQWTPWSLDVDQPLPGSGSPGPSAKALTILFDNEALQ